MAHGPNDRALSNLILGWTFAVLACVLTIVLVFLMWAVIWPLTSETSLSTKIVKAYVGEVGDAEETTNTVSRAQTKKTVDEDTVRFLIALEYAAASIRTVSVQVAFASVGGFFLIVVGVLLFASGAIQPFGLQVAAPGHALTLQNAAPGLVAVILGAVVLGMGVTRGVSHGEITFSHKQPPTVGNGRTELFRAAPTISDEPIPSDAQESNKVEGDENGV